MTPREKEIFDLIQQQPLISQSEIADQLNIARSSVAVYIASMIKQGIIQGRGYILGFNSELTPYVCVIGTVAADFIGEIDKHVRPAASDVFRHRFADFIFRRRENARSFYIKVKHAVVHRF